MLLQFSADNYKNFAEGFVLSMKPKPKQKDLVWSIQEETTGAGATYRALSSAVIFGPNASGKSNMINAVDTFKHIVSRGHIQNSVLGSVKNYAGSRLEMIPNRYLEKPKPVSFGVEFISGGVHFEYSFSADLGEFMDGDYPRSITSETLKVNQKEVFSRSERGFSFGNLIEIPPEIWGSEFEDRKGIAEWVAELTKPTDLFLMNGFRTSVSPGIAERFIDWLQKDLRVVCHAQDFEAVPVPSQNNLQEPHLESADLLTQVLSNVSPNTDWAGYLFSEDRRAHLCVGLEKKGTGKVEHFFPAEVYASYGTVRLLNILPIIVHVLENGGTLMMDEFDASIHPMLAAGIISAFHNDEINRNQAQLIVNTHNLVHMSSALYRRDEIHLIDPDWENHTTEHYTLADFGTVGENGVRKDEAYMRRYLCDTYGAIPETDMSELLLKMLKNANEQDRTNPTSEYATAEQQADDGKERVFA